MYKLFLDVQMIWGVQIKFGVYKLIWDVQISLGCTNSLIGCLKFYLYSWDVIITNNLGFWWYL